MRVYIAGPYTKPDPIRNTQIAISYADELLKLGHTPFVPHLTMLWHLVSPKKLEEWYAIDLPWIAACDALVRIPGESTGADKEVQEANRLGIPVYIGVENFINAIESQTP